MIAEARGIAFIPDELSFGRSRPSPLRGITNHTTPFATPACAAEIWSQCKALATLDILVFSLPGTWDSILSPSDVGARRKSLRKISGARTSTSMLPSTMPPAATPAYGRARAILATATSGGAMGPLVSGLAVRGKLDRGGVPGDPIN